jgi:hypothetical protein
MVSVNVFGMTDTFNFLNRHSDHTMSLHLVEIVDCELLFKFAFLIIDRT